MKTAINDANIGSKPTVFLVHSMGGIILKQLLRTARDSSNPVDVSLFENTRGIVFFATPHNGSSYALWARFLFWFLRPSDSLVALASNDPHLHDLNRWMATCLMRHIKCAQLYETQRPSFFIPLVVSRSSAGPFDSSSLSLHSPVDASHIDICKLETDKRDPYSSVLGFLKDCISGDHQKCQDFVNVDFAVQGSDTPEVRRAYWDGTAIVPTIIEYLRLGSGDSARVAIIVAPSGYGKTTLARTIARRLGQPIVWFDPQMGGARVATGKTLIVDNLRAWNNLSAARREQIAAITDSASRVIVCTRYENVAAELQGTLGEPPAAVSFPIPLLSLEKAIEFFTGHCQRPSILATFTKSDIERLCAASKGIPGLLVLALDVMNQSPPQLRAIIEKSRAGNTDALARAMFQAWLGLSVDNDKDTCAHALVLLASELCIFGLSIEHVAAVLEQSPDLVAQALAPMLELGYLQEALPGVDKSIVPHPIFRTALMSGALPCPTADVVEDWRRKLTSVSTSESMACLSALTSKIWATRDSFQTLLKTHGKITVNDVELFHRKSSELNNFLCNQLVNVDVVRESVERVIDSDVVRDCTVAVTLCRALAPLRPRTPVLGDVVWALTQHPDDMVRCDSIIAASQHWQGYQPNERKSCVEVLIRCIDQTTLDTGLTAHGFIVGCALVSMVQLGFENEALKTFAGVRERMIKGGQECAIAHVMMALAGVGTNSPCGAVMWRDVLDGQSQSECDAFARLYLFRSRALKLIRQQVDPDGRVSQHLQLPIRAKDSQRILAVGFYAGVKDYGSFVDAAVQRGWLRLGGPTGAG